MNLLHDLSVGGLWKVSVPPARDFEAWIALRALLRERCHDMPSRSEKICTKPASATRLKEPIHEIDASHTLGNGSAGCSERPDHRHSVSDNQVARTTRAPQRRVVLHHAKV
jgi:hypothetical protein